MRICKIIAASLLLIIVLACGMLHIAGDSGRRFMIEDLGIPVPKRQVKFEYITPDGAGRDIAWGYFQGAGLRCLAGARRQPKRA